MPTKIFALYLPQFHKVKENSQWWGEGYTDWVAVKNAKPLYKGHYQPQIPKDNDYYDLTNIDTIRKQCKVANQYGIAGFAIYHYWSNGKILMDKPLQLLLKNKDIKIEYFISWANHDFRQTWFGGDGHIMQAQEYGDEKEMRNHYRYLSQYFADPRYLKIDGKPVINIYNIENIKNYEARLKLWNKLAIEDGYSGIYLIATKSNTGVTSASLQKKPYVDAVFVFEPSNVRSNGSNEEPIYIFARRLRTIILRKINKYIKNKKPEFFDYKSAYTRMLKRKPCGKQIYCVFPGWDNTPRYGGNGIVFRGSTPELFGEYTKKLYERSVREGNELMIVNAWNEWGESAHLEPDEKYGYSYLEQIKKIVLGSESSMN